MLSSSVIPRANVLGVGISAVNLDEVIAEVDRAVDSPTQLGYVTVTGVHGVMESQDDPELKKIHNGSFLSIPDGIPMVWVGRWQGFDRMRQVCGPEFMPAFIAHGLQQNRRHLLWGGGDGVVDVLAAKLIERHPGIKIVGKITPPFRPLNDAEEQQLVDLIVRTRPHCFWVGLSTPKQERFMASFLERHEDRLRCAEQGLLFFGVGAAFDFQAGIVPEAPRWLRGSGFEWLYRLCTNPARLWKRYLKNNPKFIVSALLQHMDLKSFPTD